MVESTSQMEDVAAVIVGNTSAIGGSRNFLSANWATTIVESLRLPFNLKNGKLVDRIIEPPNLC